MLALIMQDHLEFKPNLKACLRLCVGDEWNLRCSRVLMYPI